MFKSLAKAIIGTALLPVDILADTFTVGGVSTNKDRTYTGERLSDIVDNLKEVTKP